MNEGELANQIFDTLMGNVGYTPAHVPFDIERVTNWQVGGNEIHFEIDGKVFSVKVTEVNSDFFKEAE